MKKRPEQKPQQAQIDTGAMCFLTRSGMACGRPAVASFSTRVNGEMKQIRVCYECADRIRREWPGMKEGREA